jgi:nucleoside-diphosphate-sugar epimerase
MSNPRLVLITGINGYIAAHTAATFLRAGYSVRGTVRARTPNVELLVNKLSEHHDGTKLELVEVPDISANGAFDRAVQGASINSPFSPTSTPQLTMISASRRASNRPPCQPRVSG